MMNRFEWLQRHSGQALAAILVITALLAIPFLAMAPTETASTEPSGSIFFARDRIDQRFDSSVHTAFYIVEHEEGDLLRAEPLAELLSAQRALQEDPVLGPSLLSYFDAQIKLEVNGAINLATVIDSELRKQGIAGVEAASDAQVKMAGALVIEQFGEQSSALGLSPLSKQASNGDWTVPALAFPVLSDDDVLGFGNTSINLGGDTEPEEYDRSVQAILRGADGFQVNGVAIDVNLTSQEQGAIAGPFIGFTVVAVLLLVGLTFRSYWVLATVSVAFMIMLIWLKGISNLIGLKDDLVLSLIVPVAMISFGVDFAFHAIGRYREERAVGMPSGTAFVTGMTAVSGALVLALISDAAAFLSNLTSGIESINQFGIGAAIALVSAYVLLGIATPLAIARIEADIPSPSPGRRSTWFRIAGSINTAAMTMGSVLLLVFVAPRLGLVLSVITAFLTVALPYLFQRRKIADETSSQTLGQLPVSESENIVAQPIGAAIAAIAAKPRIVLPIALGLTAVAAVFAVRVPVEFDVEDFFASDTDFVTSLDQLDTHVGDRGGEPALIYIEGDMTDPVLLAQLSQRVDEISELDTASLARGKHGVEIDAGVLAVLDAAWESGVMIDLVQQQSGVILTDKNEDAIPDTREQVIALLSVASQTGVPFDTTRLMLTPDDVRTAVSIEGPVGATVLGLSLVDSRSQSSVAAARADLKPIAQAISTDFGGTFVEVTGSPFIREASLAATSRALQISLPVALLLCLAIGSIFLRSIRYGLASIVPILMVVAWLYAFIEFAGYSINLVTATIAAVSIGIGIDFAIHFISRYREELARSGSRQVAVRSAGEGTGVALVASALSSAIGFGLLALAPMPLFATYGLLTALMIVLALLATLVVLPSLLVLITSDKLH